MIPLSVLDCGEDLWLMLCSGNALLYLDFVSYYRRYIKHASMFGRLQNIYWVEIYLIDYADSEYFGFVYGLHGTIGSVRFRTYCDESVPYPTKIAFYALTFVNVLIQQLMVVQYLENEFNALGKSRNPSNVFVSYCTVQGCRSDVAVNGTDRLPDITWMTSIFRGWQVECT